MDQKKNPNKKKKILYCNNCNNFGHFFKRCSDPITSWGIILIKIENNIRPIIHSENTTIFNNGIYINNKYDLNKIHDNINDIKFLLISRKHSLGFIEFIRGRYKISNIEHIKYLIQQMQQNEIDNIKNNINTFKHLWKYLWGNDQARMNNFEYNISKKKFDQLNNELYVDVKLEYLLDNIKPNYLIPEYGFPKGRKNKSESDRECAIREFCEESNLDKNDIKIIDEINPITENLIGTNGIKYRHIYYVAEYVSDKIISDINISKLNNETGNMDFYNYVDSALLIRSYHIEKYNIVTQLLFYYLNKILNE